MRAAAHRRLRVGRRRAHAGAVLLQVGHQRRRVLRARHRQVERPRRLLGRDAADQQEQGAEEARPDQQG